MGNQTFFTKLKILEKVVKPNLHTVHLYEIIKKPTSIKVGFLIRKGWDSNPRQSFPCTNVPGLHLKPLGHLSLGLFILFITKTITPVNQKFQVAI